MFRYALQRILYGFVTLFLVVSLTFLLLQLLPGSPFNDAKLTDEQVAILNDKYGLDDPLPLQYARYMGGVIKGDFGTSFRYDNQPVFGMITGRLKYTVTIGLQALLLGTLVGILLGALAALKKGSLLDSLTILVAILGVSIPSYVLGTIMQFSLGVKLNLLPIVFVQGDPISSIMPTISLAFFVIASSARFMRTELVEVLGTDYVLLAQAKGLSRAQIVIRHAVRNALIPVITVVGPMTVTLLTGSTVIERIYGIPGIANLLVDAIMRNDYFVILGVATFYSMMFIFVLIVIDLLYGIIDPRIRLAGGAK